MAPRFWVFHQTGDFDLARVCMWHLFIISICLGIYTKSNGEQQDVAVKVPKLEGKTTSHLRDFYLEAQITTTFQHENILSCLGISADPSGGPWLIFEYMPFGDLAQVLRSNSGVFLLHREDLPQLKMVIYLLYTVVIHTIVIFGAITYCH